MSAALMASWLVDVTVDWTESEWVARTADKMETMSVLLKADLMVVTLAAAKELWLADAMAPCLACLKGMSLVEM